MRVLIIKMSSMGDLLHTLPALSEAKKYIPNISFDWLVEPSFVEIPSWHPAVENVIPIGLRNLKKNFFQALNNSAIANTIRKIRAQEYALVIDAQGLLKSALLSKIVRTKIVTGFDKHSIREPLASYFYTKKFAVSWKEHAVTRVRALFAHSLGYTLPTSRADYQIQLNDLTLTPDYQVPKPYVVLLHGTTWQNKHWPDEYWLELALKLQQRGLYSCATWSNKEQLARIQKIAALVSNFKILPPVNLNQAAIILQQAKAAVAVDTGFAHLAAALDLPLVSIYGPTDPIEIGTLGKHQIHLSASYDCSRCERKTCKEVTQGSTLCSPCMSAITPDQVLLSLESL